MLCVAFNHTYKTTFYEEGKEKDTFEKIEDEEATEDMNRLLGRKQGWYIVGTGTHFGFLLGNISAGYPRNIK